jgi:hypothetical protein
MVVSWDEDEARQLTFTVRSELTPQSIYNAQML